MVNFSHLHYNIIQHVIETISGKSESNCAKGYCNNFVGNSVRNSVLCFVVVYQIFSFLKATIYRQVRFNPNTGTGER